VVWVLAVGMFYQWCEGLGLIEFSCFGFDVMFGVWGLVWVVVWWGLARLITELGGVEVNVVWRCS